MVGTAGKTADAGIVKHMLTTRRNPPPTFGSPHVFLKV